MSCDEEDPYFDPSEEVRRLFPAWRSPRHGSANPETMKNPVWDWLIRTRVNAFRANEVLNGPDPFTAGPGWCFCRYGQTSTTLSDGRVVQIGGEHEDSYDPDFCIYNDVVVRDPAGGIEIFGYPTEIFPPTDFHSATLVADRIVVIGNLGYPEQRKPQVTPIYELDLKQFSFHRIEAIGEMPGWIQRHTAELQGDGIVITSGNLDRGERGELIENVDDWALCLTTHRWERLTKRGWAQWEFTPADKKVNGLWELRSAAWQKGFEEQTGKLFNASLPEELQALSALILESREKVAARLPKVDLDSLYCPSIEHRKIEPSENEYNVYRVQIGDVVVRFVEETGPIRMIIEGHLPVDVETGLVAELQQKLGAIEGSSYLAKKRA